MIEGIANIVSDDPLEPRATLKRSRPSGQRHAFPLDRLHGMIGGGIAAVVPLVAIAFARKSLPTSGRALSDAGGERS